LIFSSVQYLIFLPIVVFLYWRLKGQARLILTVVSSYIFYMSWLPLYGVLLLLMTAINWGLSLGIEKYRTVSKTTTRVLLWAGLILNVGALCYYKYVNFVLENICRAIHAAAPFFPAQADYLSRFNTPLVDALLPLGISFFVFEFVHYLSDVYRGDKAVKSFFEFAAFAVFFPSQIAGPIKRYQDFIPKLRNPLPLTNPLLIEGTSLFMQGLFKKAAIADPIGAIIAGPFTNLQALSAGDAWIAAIGFTIQVYCDFSGYTDMGRGSALLLGIRLPLNFNLPLLSPDLSAFWRRWHISLGSWLKDYVYIPLGGSREGVWTQNRNLFITMVVCGIWHGASWHYIIFGAMQGAGLIVHRQWCTILDRLPVLKKALDNKFGVILGTVQTVAFIGFTYALFRAPDMPHAINMWTSLVNFHGPVTLIEPVFKSGILVIATVYFAFWQATEYLRKHETFVDGWLKSEDRQVFANPLRLATYTVAAILMVASKPLEAVPFVYFQF
jgi:alginate O-acetyltransferase complex protein AlgI